MKGIIHLRKRVIAFFRLHDSSITNSKLYKIKLIDSNLCLVYNLMQDSANLNESKKALNVLVNQFIYNFHLCENILSNKFTNNFSFLSWNEYAAIVLNQMAPIDDKVLSMVLLMPEALARLTTTPVKKIAIRILVLYQWSICWFH